MPPDFETIQQRAVVWGMAASMTEPVVEMHGFESARDGAAMFSNGSYISKVEQHLESIERVADWLLVDER